MVTVGLTEAGRKVAACCKKTALEYLKIINDITTEELTVFSGMEDILSLLRLFTYYQEKPMT